MPYYIGDVIKDEKMLIARTPEQFRETGIDVRIDTRVEEVDPKAKRVRLADGETLPYDVLVLGTGTMALMPGIPGEEREGVFTLKKLSDALRIKAWLRDVPCRKAIIVGAGFIGMEMSEALRNLGIETQRLPPPEAPRQPLGPRILEDRAGGARAASGGVRHRGRDAGRGGGEEYRLRLVTNRGEDEADMILMAVGIRPDTELARQMGLPLGKTGAIRVRLLPAHPAGGGVRGGRLLRNPSTG